MTVLIIFPKFSIKQSIFHLFFSSTHPLPLSILHFEDVWKKSFSAASYSCYMPPEADFRSGIINLVALSIFICDRVDKYWAARLSRASEGTRRRPLIRSPTKRLHTCTLSH
ncbi:hypothetical protein AVEN_190946-1 [Araneus ventricosus]|uniref:Uncharacterized protein n=1 Tax=Araneus ventricosus TaxID=182803 RepID=A0A4Y2JG99_ARAVE|nr:hypothetical protein AVEN_190946-1 [Araneus ventricosus]